MAGIIVSAILLVLAIALGIASYRRTLAGRPYSGSMKGAVSVGLLLGLFLGIAVGLATLLAVLVARKLR